ncbi:aldose 1-epimerase-like [Acanthaster planci]|uniref:Aldose 1-epimerase n=1 Tax=Acanthaster planci TaxID=133434 RepID=A0A8B7Z6W5_ACAPL|nr:aldose 1-epimerase-like [Acanthaster planci]XP_022101385.1 aldose 1-epimerase-like [Acanthaster planci]XP_022101386.1 aldose 1-epimerase-like [Acanthaster planci]XP_022101387.1 aldose 1-epimerase-like [Acanthaster planci]XP_022101388.1 aldose 1-epimerase-like [Acanthaster planci]
MPITQEDFGHTKDGRLVVRYSLSNKNGMVVKIINFGAAVTSIEVPDRAGNIADVVLGYDKLEGYETGAFYHGIVVGRVANRIAKGRFVIDGKEYQLETNNGPNHLHGGFKGFGLMLWNATVEGSTLKLTRVSPDGEQCYPGEMTVEVRYELTDENILNVVYSAVTTAPTPINLTNHSYFNLAGHNGDTIKQHQISIDADRYIPVSDELIPIGEMAPVKDTVFDLREQVELADRIRDAPGGGIDHSFCLNVPSLDKPSIKLVDPATGRSLEVSTTQPGVHFYTGNFLDGSEVGKKDIFYPKHGGLCLETGNFPDAINQDNFPNAILRPGEKYLQATSFKFSW